MIRWPEATHSKSGRRELFSAKQPYRAAREVIDWELPNPSIFNRKRPLKPNTMRRILAGLEKFNPHLQPFITTLRQNVTAKSVDEPLGTITAGGTHLALCEPYLVNMKGQSTASSIDNPTPTQTTMQHQYLCEPVILGQQGGAVARSVDSPVPTIATAGAISITQPVLLKVTHGDGDKGRPQDLNGPLPTLTTKNGIGMAEAFILPQFGEAAGRSVEKPLGTLTTTSRGVGLVEPFIVPFLGEREGQHPRTHSVDAPMSTVTSNPKGLVEPIVIPIDHTGSGDRGARSVNDSLSTITTEARHGLAEAFLTKYYGTAQANSVEDPLDTVTTKDRFGLVQPEWNGYRLDIRFRMLQPHELAAAMTFPKNYPFTGSKSDVTKQIGNAVPPVMGEVLAMSLLEDYATKRDPAEVIPMPLVEDVLEMAGGAA